MIGTRVLTILIMLFAGTTLLGQQPAAPAPPPQAAPAQQSSPAPAPAAPSQSVPATTPAEVTPATAPQASQAPPKPRPHVAKTREEYDAYQDIMSKTDLAQAEAAAQQFEQKFPDSDLKGVIYQHLMDKYQEANNAQKTLEMARKVIQFSPTDPVALSTAATMLAEITHDTDPDRNQRFDEAEGDARQAIANIDTLQAPANWTPQQFQDAKNVILAYAHAAIGLIELRKGDNAAAETELRTATQLNQSQPDAPTWYRLALALDHQQKYAEALVAVNRSLQYFHPGDDMANVAKDEQTRLMEIVGQSPPAANANPTPPANGSAAPQNPAPPAAASPQPPPPPPHR